jgi:hypothetical protein
LIGPPSNTHAAKHAAKRPLPSYHLLCVHHRDAIQDTFSFFSMKTRWVLPAFCAIWFGAAACASAQTPTRTEALKIAETFINHRWDATAKNAHHGADADGIEVHTPDRDGERGDPLSDCWEVDSANVGVAYKWGGFDNPSSYDAGLRAGKAAGDIYTAEKRRQGGAAVSRAAVGIDCSGFISRCWKLPKKHSTSMLAAICQKLASAAELRPADIMNAAEGHVLMFAKWLDDKRSRALFYEAAPFSKTRAIERDISEMLAEGYQPLRYSQIRN